MHLRLKVKDLDCIDCARALEKLAGTIDGVEEARVSFTLSVLDLNLSDETFAKSVVRSLKRKGYETYPAGQARGHGLGEVWGAVSRRRLFLTSISGLFLLAALAAHLAAPGGPAARLMLVGATAAALPLTLIRGIYAVRSFQIDMNVLMSIAILAAALIGEWAEAGMVAFLFSVAIILEALAMARTRRAIESLMELSPDTAVVRREGEQVELHAADVRPGDIVIVKPGERIPLEGLVVSGITSVDESPITGEPMPAAKEEGSQVFAGTLNEEGLIEVEVTKVREESTLARIVHLVEHVEESKAPLERFIDRFARIYTPVVMVAAVLIAVVPGLMHLEGNWIYRSLVILIIACPCALVIATPVAVVSGLASAARRGILIKGGAHMEQAAAVKAIALDKTGTLTEGRPSVAAVVPRDGISENQLLRIASAVESASAHPLAGAVLAESRRRGIHWPEPEEVVATTGMGISGVVDGVRYHAAKPEFFKNHRPTGEGTGAGVTGVGLAGVGKIGAGEAGVAQTGAGETGVRQADGTTILVGTDDSIMGRIDFKDRLRSKAADTILALKDLGIRKIVMVTGDRGAAAAEVAAGAGVDEYHADLMPEDKVAVVEGLKREFEVVAMVGDGVNDAPALAAAHVGIAMGAAGSDTAIDTASVALMSDDVSRLVPLFDLARKVRLITQENIGFAIAIKAAFIILAAMGSATMWMAVFADMGASLIVIANALRLLSDRAVALKSEVLPKSE
jgi:Cd2+/Zn2+-exporting ATPase